MFNFFKKLIQNIVPENFVKNYIEKKYNVKVEKIKKQNGKTYAVLENNIIYSNKIPDIIDFVSDNDYRKLLMFYGTYQRKNIDKIMKKPYPYNKYDWNTLMEIIWVNQYYNKHLQEFKKTGIKKVKLICICNCDCCKDLLNKEIPIGQIQELPIKECDFECRICIGAKYLPVVEFK